MIFLKRLSQTTHTSLELNKKAESKFLCLVASSNVYCFLPYKESTKTINDVLVEKSKEQWRRSNTSLAMRIAEITESFGKELAGKWSNETSPVRSSEDNIGEQHSFLLAFLIQASYLVIGRI